MKLRALLAVGYLKHMIKHVVIERIEALCQERRIEVIRILSRYSPIVVPSLRHSKSYKTHPTNRHRGIFGYFGHRVSQIGGADFRPNGF